MACCHLTGAQRYPGGFAMLRVHEGGYSLNFYKTRNSTADRNYVVRRDLSGLRRAADVSARAGRTTDA